MPPLPGTLAQPIRPIVFGGSPGTATVPLVPRGNNTYGSASVPYAPVSPLTPVSPSGFTSAPNGGSSVSPSDAIANLERTKAALNEAALGGRPYDRDVTRQVSGADPTGQPTAGNQYSVGAAGSLVEIHFGYYYEVGAVAGTGVADVAPSPIGGAGTGFPAPVELYFDRFSFWYRPAGAGWSVYDFASLNPRNPVQWRVFFRPLSPGAPLVPAPSREPFPPGGTPAPYLDPAPSVPDYLPYNPEQPGQIEPYRPGGLPVPSERPGFPESVPGEEGLPGRDRRSPLPGRSRLPGRLPGRGSPRPVPSLPSPNPWDMPQTKPDEDLGIPGGGNPPVRPKDPDDCCEQILEAVKKLGCRFRVKDVGIPFFSCENGFPSRENLELGVPAEINPEDESIVNAADYLYREIAEQLAVIREGNFGCEEIRNGEPNVIYEGDSYTNKLVHRIQLEDYIKSVVVIITGTLPVSLSFYKTSSEGSEVEAKFGNIGIAVGVFGGAFAWDSKPGWLWTRRTYYRLPQTSLSPRILRLTLKSDLQFVVYDSGER